LTEEIEMGYTTEDLFNEIDGKTYASYREFEDEVIGLFNQHLSDFPPHYTYRDAITWADRNGWLHPSESEFSVDMRGVAAA
jgi:hypothetical protein